MKSINQAHAIELSGLFDINLNGGSGRDTLNVDLGGPGGFTDDEDDPGELNALNRTFRLRVEGGTDDDAINVNLSNSDLATFGFDVALRGNTGNDTITFVGNNQGGSPTFGPAGFILIDGGLGDGDRCSVSGNFPVHTQNCEM